MTGIYLVRSSVMKVNFPADSLPNINKNMNWKKGVIFGVLIWILMFVIVSIFVGFKIYGSTWMHIITAIIAGAISYVFAGKIKPNKAKLALSYGLAWVLIGVILDALITMRSNPAIFSSRSLWLGYILVLLAPLLQVKKSQSPAAV